MDKTYNLSLRLDGVRMADVPFYADSDTDAAEVGKIYFENIKRDLGPTTNIVVSVTDLVIGFFDGVSFSTGKPRLIHHSFTPISVS